MRITFEQAWHEFKVSLLARGKAWTETNGDYEGKIYQRAQARHDRAILVCNRLVNDPYMTKPWVPPNAEPVITPMKSYRRDRVFLRLHLANLAEMDIGYQNVKIPE